MLRLQGYYQTKKKAKNGNMNRTKRLLISMLTLLCCTGALATGELNGFFTINASGDKVQFSQGNLQATYNGSAWSWAFATNQWDYIGGANNKINGNGTVSANGTVDLFGWVGASSSWTGAAMYGISNSTATNAENGYGTVADEALKSDWGNTIGAGWRTLSSDEWKYILSDRASGSTVNDISNARYTHATINTDGTSVNGMILFPDDVTIADDEATSWGSVNGESACTRCTSAQWAALAAKGCVFLPAAGMRDGASVSNTQSVGYYQSSSPTTTNVNFAWSWYFSSDYLSKPYCNRRNYAYSVRLVKDCTLNTLNQDGEGNYLIGSVQDWKDFATLVQTTPTANAKMTADIDLGDDQTTIGSGNTNAENAIVVYQGVFDGNGHTLTINYNTSEGFYAPIRHISGATIKNLHVTGSIVSSGGRVGGIVCGVFGGSSIQSKIEKCRSSVVLTSNCQVTVSDAESVGGIVGQVGFKSNLSLEDCIFDGEITGHVSNVIWSGLVGVLDGNVNTTRCLQAGSFNDLNNGTTANSATIVCRWQNAATSIVTMDATYYIHSFKTVQGTQATTAELADGTTTTALNAGRTGDAAPWVQLGSQPMLKAFVVTLTDGDNLSALETFAGKTCTVAYSRSFTAGMSSTVCLPFAFAKGSVGTFYTFTGITKNGSGEYIADMTEYTGANLVANTPYLFTPSTTGSVDFGGTYAIPASITAGSTVSGDWTFLGTYETISWTEAPTGIYGFSAQAVDGISLGEFVKVGAYVRIRPMRCYLKYKNGGEDYAGARSMTRSAEAEPLPQTIKVRLIGANGEVTAIGSLQTNTGEVTFDSDAWYTLDGVQLNGKPTRKGIYVNNGKKVIIK